MLIYLGALMLAGADAVCIDGGLRASVNGFVIEAQAERLVLRGEGPLPPRSSEGSSVITGQELNGRSFELKLDEAWTIKLGGEQTHLELSPGVRRPKQARLLALAAGTLWLGSTDFLARLDLATLELSAARLGGRPYWPLLIASGDELLIAAGSELLACQAPSTCRRVGRLRGTVQSVVSGSGGWLYALAGASAGLYRAPTGAPATATLLTRGDVVALCPTGEGGALAVMRRGEDMRLVAAATSTPALRLFPPHEVLSRAVIETEQPDPTQVEHILASASAEKWAERDELALHLAADPRPVVRRVAAKAVAAVAGPRGMGALWLLGHDTDPEVRLDALYAAQERCKGDRVAPCDRTLGLFFDDTDHEIAWLARDLMLAVDPRQAVDAAPPEYKLEVIPTLMARVQRDGMRAAHDALRALADDPDERVRDAAGQAIASLTP